MQRLSLVVTLVLSGLLMQAAGLSLSSRPSLAVETTRKLSVAPGNRHFEQTWARTDKPVADGRANRTWMWGPAANTGVFIEAYLEGPNGEREVQYFDKARMEITDPAADSDSVWFTTNGLLVVELVTGRMQVGHETFVERPPAWVPVAGDPDDTSGPTYASLIGLLDSEPLPVGAEITRRIDMLGNVTDDPMLADQGITTGYFDEVTDHAIAAPFWEFMNATGTVADGDQYVEDRLFVNPFFATGRPIIEPYWADVKVAGTVQLVLLQCFERRCLTYTPQNDPNWRVEAGNVGLHYLRWRGDEQQRLAPPAGPAANVAINEVLYLPQSDEPEWVELANRTGDTQSLDGMILTNGDGSKQVDLPAWTLPDGAHVVVIFGEGANDADPSDGTGTFYTGDNLVPFFTRSDVALYQGSPAPESIVDFVSWAYLGDYDPGSAHDHAVAAEIWVEGTYFKADNGDPEQAPADRLVTEVLVGDSIGRDASASDTNVPADWGYLGGRDAIAATPGERNWSEFLDELRQSTGDTTSAPRTPLQTDDLPLPEKKWTIMVYADGRDPTLVDWQVRLMEELRDVGSNEDVNIVFQFIRTSGASLEGSVTTFDRGRIGEAGLIFSGRWEVLGGGFANPGDPAQLGEFIDWAQTNFPAERYAINFQGHGVGWKGILVDDADEDFLTMAELEDGLSALDGKFSVVWFDNCLMAQTEVGHQIADQAEYMLASEEVSWATSALPELVEGVQDQPDASNGDVAQIGARLQRELREAEGNTRYTWSATYLADVRTAVTPAVHEMSVKLAQDIEHVGTMGVRDDNRQLYIKQAREQALQYDDGSFIDLWDFADKIEPFPLEAAQNAHQVRSAVEQAVRYNAHGTANENSESHGLTIYFPRNYLLPHDLFPNPAFANPLFDPRAETDTRATYLYKQDAGIQLTRLANEPYPMEDDPDFRFPDETGWDEFLHRYYKPVADACIQVGSGCLDDATFSVGETITLTAVGSSDSDGPIPDDNPAWYYWDLDLQSDVPPPAPAYAENQRYRECTDEDCDRNGADTMSDDPDRSGATTVLTCGVPPADRAEFQVRLVVLDEVHEIPRVGNEDRRHNDGRHWLHFNLDEDLVTVRCLGTGSSVVPPPPTATPPGVPPPPTATMTPTPTMAPTATPTATIPPTQPISKQSGQELVQPGQYIDYAITVPANPELQEPSEGEITDPINADFFIGMQDPVIEELTCSIGECFYDPAENNVVWLGTFSPGDVVEMSFSILVPGDYLPSEYPEEYLNCIQGFDGVESFAGVCATTAVVLPDEE